MSSFLFGITLVSDCGYKGEDNEIVIILYDKTLCIYKTVKSSHLKNIQILENNLIFNVMVALDSKGHRGKGKGGGKE